MYGGVLRVEVKLKGKGSRKPFAFAKAVLFDKKKRLARPGSHE